MESLNATPVIINLSEKHLSELRDGSGLSEATIKAAGLYTELDHCKISKILGWSNRDGSWNDVLVIPYLHTNGEYTRLKPSWPRRDYKGKPVKYESPKGSTNRAYFGIQGPPAKGLLIYTEGEKKTLAIQQAGFHCIGMPGVWNWQKKRLKTDTGRSYGKRELIDDLDAIDHQGREVVICFDSDSAKNPSVQLASARFAETLDSKGASVRVAIIPSDGDEKVGADDYIVKYGEDAFRKLIEQAKPADPPPKLSVMDLARLYIDEFYTSAEGITLRWWRNEYYVYHHDHYEKVPRSELEAITFEWLDRIQQQVKPRHAAEVVEAIGALCRVPFDIDMPVNLSVSGERRPHWIAFRNGILDLDAAIRNEKTELIPHTPNWFSTFTLPYGYDPAATCETWYTTLEQIFDNGDNQHFLDCEEALSQFFGLTLIDDTSYHVLPLLQGPKRTGKGTVLRTLKMMLGEGNYATPTLASLGSQFGLWGLLGKRVAIIGDAQIGKGDKAASVLEMLNGISGEDAQDVHRKFLPTLTGVRLPIRFVIACNQIPKLPDHANALASRLLIFPFKNSFLGKEDRDREKKLTAEAPGIFNWALDGLRRLLAQKRFTVPKASSEMIAEFERNTSPVKAFLDDCCTLAAKRGDDCRVSRDDLWEAWKAWCDTNNQDKGTKSELGMALSPLVPFLGQSQPWQGEKAARKKTRYYTGVKLGKDIGESE